MMTDTPDMAPNKPGPRRLSPVALRAAMSQGLLDPLIAGKTLPAAPSHNEKLHDVAKMQKDHLRTQSLGMFLKKQRLTPPHKCACGETISANKTKCGACAK